MYYPEKEAKKLNMDLFRNPTVNYRGIPFWSWNCRVTEQMIDEQLDIFQRMGFGGVDIHPRSGLDTAYLSEEYMRLIHYTVKRCEEKGMLCWLYDDDRFPSGAADGLVTRDPRFRQRCLILTEECRPDFFPDRFAFDAALDRNETSAGWLAAEYAVNCHGARRLHGNEELLPGETRRYGYVMLLEPEDWFQGQTYADVMNPLAVRRFLEITHESYYQEVGEFFGNAIPAIFTDEPRMETRTNRHPKQLVSNRSHDDVIIPWSDALRERLLQEKNLDILDIAPALVWDFPQSQEIRYHFRNAASEQFVSSFMDQIAAWCSKHNILMTGHVLSEDTLSSQAASLGDCMRCYRSMDLPGIDVLCDDRQFLTAKQAASVAHQYGREGIVSELYGVTEWNCDFKTFKLQGDWQAALGVTTRVPHLSWMSMEGEAKRDWPGSIFYQSPWWQEFRTIEDYFARLNTVLTRGKPEIEIAVLHPVESMWLYLGTQEGTAKKRQEMDARFNQLVEVLMFNQLDFDLISESLLQEQRSFSDRDGWHVGEMTYRFVIVPDMDTIRDNTLTKLEQFIQQGGQVIFMGRVPELVDMCPSDRAVQLSKRGRKTNTLEDLCMQLDEARLFSIRKEDGSPANNLLYQLRKDGEVEWLFLCHAYHTESHHEVPEKYQVRFYGNYKVTCYDPMTGDSTLLTARYADGNTVISWISYAEDSLLLCLTLTDKPVAEIQKGNILDRYMPVQELLTPETVSLTEPNMLILDYACARLDEGPSTQKTEILRLDNMIRKQLGFKLRYGSMMQPYAMDEKEVHSLTLYYDILSEIEADCQLGMEHPEQCEIFLNGTRVKYEDQGWYVDHSIRKLCLPSLKKGHNHLQILLDYHQKTNLENVYLLGNFDVRKQPSGENGIVRKTEKSLGDITSQGLPFYSGIITYHLPFYLENSGEYAVRVPEYAAALLTVHLDGIKMGQIAYAPDRLALGNISAGEHVLKMDAFIGRHNGFGYLHNCDDQFRWYGPDAWRTIGKQWTDDYILKPAGILAGIVLERREG